MLKVLLVLGLSHTAAAGADDQPYCALRYRRLCQGKGRHVACQFPDPGPGTSCQNYTQIKFTSDLKHSIVHYINKRRQRIAAGNERVRGGVHLPRPEIMMLVSWDRELASLAQRLADQCHFMHDDCRATVRYPYAGQSVGEVRWRGGGAGEAARLGAQRALRRVLDAWWGERRRAHARQLLAPFRLTHKDMVWGHFSQLAVWNLRAVGCGAVRHGFEHARMLLVCDFSHTNMLGQRTITPGSLAPCPIHTARRPRSAYPLLCAPIKRPTPPEKYEHENTKDYDDGYDEENYEDDQEEEEEMRTTKQSLGTTRKHKDRTVQKFRSDFTMTRKGRDRDRRIQTEKGNFSFGYQQAMSKSKKTTRRVIEEFAQDMEMNSNEQVPLRKHHQWETRRPGFGRSWEKSDDEDYVILSNAKNKFRAQDDEDARSEEQQKPISRPDVISNHGLHSRQRWTQTRMRPQRPGANALLNKPPEKHLRRSSISMISFVLDKDDSDQLFRDTGFNINWRKQKQ